MRPHLRERTKVVVRRLPPSLPEEDFKTAVDAKFEGQYSWFSYTPGKVSSRSVKHSRAYLNFNDPLHVYDFRSKFDGHTFVNDKGAQFSCSVEYAPCQKVPKKLRKQDPKEGTLEKDADFQEFVENLDKEPAASLEVSQATTDDIQLTADGKRITPLMQFLHDKWTGKIQAPSGKSRQKRQKAEKVSEEKLAPPPGFDPLPTPGSRSQKGRGSTRTSAVGGRGDLKTAQEAVSAALEGVGSGASKAGGVAGKERPSKKKGSSRKGPATENRSDEGPKRILKKPAVECTAPSSEAPAAQQSEEGEGLLGGPTPATRSAAKPVRVRAGYQVYTPRHRSEEPGAQASAPSLPQVEEDVEAKAGRTLATKERPSGRGKSSNAAPKEGGQEHHDAGGPERQPGKSSRRKGRSSEGRSRVAEPPQDASGGSFPGASTGDSRAVLSEEGSALAPTPVETSQGSVPASGRGRGRGSRGGGRRHWRAKTEPSG